jgi:hypothetical protein
MFKMNGSKFFGLLMLGLTANYAEAARGTRREERREHRQDERIKEGVRSGELTRHEAKHLQKEQRRIDRAERRAASDGKVTGVERAKIERMQNHASRSIYRQKHDAQEHKQTEAAKKP